MNKAKMFMKVTSRNPDPRIGSETFSEGMKEKSKGGKVKKIRAAMEAEKKCKGGKAKCGGGKMKEAGGKVSDPTKKFAAGGYMAAAQFAMGQTQKIANMIGDARKQKVQDKIRTEADTTAANTQFRNKMSMDMAEKAAKMPDRDPQLSKYTQQKPSNFDQAAMARYKNTRLNDDPAKAAANRAQRYSPTQTFQPNSNFAPNKVVPGQPLYKPQPPTPNTFGTAGFSAQKPRLFNSGGLFYRRKK